MYLLAGFGWGAARMRYALAPLLALISAQAAWAGEAFTLPRLEQLAQDTNPALRAEAASVDAAQAGVQTARAYPNPEVEYMAGTMRYRPTASGFSGASDSIGVTQALDLPFRRTPRIDAARAGLSAARADYAAFATDWIADLRRAYFDVLRRTAERKNAQADLDLMQSVHAKISLRVRQGDAPRYELIRAEADLLGVQKNAQAAALREEQARLGLRAMVGPQLPVDFEVEGTLDATLMVGSASALAEQAMAANPTLARAQAQAEQARHRLTYERAGRLPTVALRASHETDREMRQSRVGVTISIPLWDRRLGPVREAAAQAAQAELRADAQGFAVRQQLDIALRQHEVALAQVSALENGLVAQAKAAVTVAEAAYKAGERGLMDVLDAQRVYRAARADLIASRYDLALAWVEIQRLIANSAPRSNP